MRTPTRLLCVALLAPACQGGSPPKPAPPSPQPGVIAEPVPLASFRVIGHRGAAGHAPENTLPSFEAARALGVEEVELDVQLSRDGVPILFHDGSLERKTDLTGSPTDYDADELLQADIGTWFDSSHPEPKQRFAGVTLVSLDRVLEQFGERFHYHVELKTESPRAPRLVLENLERRKLRRRATFTSFHLEQLRRTRRLDPEVRLCLLIGDLEDLAREASVDEKLAGLFGRSLQERRIDRAAEESFQMVAFPARDLSRPLVDYAHALGLEIRAWGVREPADLDHTIEVGADGATLDHPEWALERRRNR